MIDVSVIVPVHNTGQYLCQCLDSLLKQTLPSLEVIAIDNGSTDNSGAILEEYSTRHSDRLVVGHLPTADVSLARNEGFRLSRGRYIGYVDSDDFIQHDMFEKLHAKAQSIPGGYDVVVCDMDTFFDDSSQSQYISCDVHGDVQDADGIKKVFVDSYAVITNKIFRRSLLEGVCFTPKVWSEDIEFLYRVFPGIGSIGVVPIPLYHYRQRTGSLTHIFNDRLYDYITNFDAIVEDYKRRGYYDAYHQELEYQYVRYVYATMVKRLAKSRDRTVFREGVRTAQRSVKTRFPTYRKNRLFFRKGLKGIYLILFNPLFADLVYWRESKRQM